MKNQLLVCFFLFTYIIAFTQSDNLYRIQKENKWGIIDTSFQMIIPPKYEQLVFYSPEVIAFKEIKGLWGFMNYKGEIITPAMYEIERYTEDYPKTYWKVSPQSYKTDPNVTEAGKYRPYFNKKKTENEWSFEPAEFEATPSENIESFMKEQLFSHAYLFARKAGKMGALNAKGEEICPFNFEFIFPYEINTVNDENDEHLHSQVFQVKLDGKYGLMDNSFQPILPAIYEYLVFWDNYAIILVAEEQEFENGMYIKDEDWNFIEQSDYPLDCKYSLYSITGQRISTHSYDMISNVPRRYYAKAQIGKLFGLINRQGQEVIPIKYKCIVFLSDMKYPYKVCEKGLWGFLNSNGEVKIPIEYQVIGNFHNYTFKDINNHDVSSSNALARKNDKYGVIDLEGNELLPFKYDYLTRFDENDFIYYDNGSYYIISVKGEKLSLRIKFN